MLTPTSRAAATLADIRFHQSFYLDADLSAGRAKRLRITYSDFGHRPLPATDDHDNAVVLFCGGLMGGRWNLTMSDGLAREMKVRVLVVDRPGMGGSDQVRLDRRIQTWLG